MARMLAAKTALMVRKDALGEDVGDAELGIEVRAKLERRIKSLEEGHMHKISGSGKARAKFDKYENKSFVKTYDEAQDSTLAVKKRKIEEVMEVAESKPKKTKLSVSTPTATTSGVVKSDVADELPDADSEKKSKKKKRKSAGNVEDENVVVKVETDVDASSSKKKKRKSDSVVIKTEHDKDTAAAATEMSPDALSAKKKKKKKKADKQHDSD